MATITDTYDDESKINTTDGSEISRIPEDAVGNPILDFDGNDYIESSDSNIIFPNKDSWSTSIWFNSDVTGGTPYDRLFTGHKTVGGGSGYTVAMHNGDLSVYISDTGVYTDIKTDIELNKFHHFIGTYDGTTFRGYVNGVLELELVTGMDAFVAEPFVIGNYRSSATQYGWDGNLSQLKIWSRELTPTEVLNLYNTGEVTDTSNQVSSWNLNDNSSTIEDSWGSNTGTLTGGTWEENLIQPSELRNLTDDNTLTFNGSSDVVVAPYSTSLMDTGDASSVSLWFNIDGLSPGKNEDLLEQASVSYRYLFWFNDSNNTINFFPGTAGQSFTITNNQWYHLVGTVDGTTARFYVDGVEIGSGISYTPRDTTGNFNIGRRPITEGEHFTGKISQIKIWDKTLTSTEALNLYKTGDVEDETNQVSYWKLDEGTGTSIADSWGANIGTLTGGTWKTETFSSERSQTISTDLLDGLGATSVDNFKYTTSKKGGGVNARLAFADDYDADRENVLSFDGINDTVALTNYDPSGDDFSMSEWICIDKWDDYAGTLFGRDGSYLLGVLLFPGNKVRFYTYFAGGSQGVTSTKTFEIGKWYHISATYENGVGSKIYIDGVRDGTGSNAGTISVNSDMLLGNEPGVANRYFEGKIAEAKVYDDVLTADEVKYLYTNGKDGVDPTDTNLVSYWKLDEGTGTTATDSHGSNDGTINGATWDTDIILADWFADWRNSNDDSVSQRAYYSFDGINDSIQVTQDASFDNIFSSGGSVSVWINPKGLGEVTGRIYDKRDNGGYMLFIGAVSGDSAHLSFFQDFTVDGRWNTDFIIPLNAWSHILVTYDNSLATNDPIIYVNGVSVNVTEDTTPTGSAISDSSSQMSFGNRHISDRTFDGDISDIQMYDTILTSSEAWDLYSKSQLKSSNQVSRWKLDGDALDSWGSNDGVVDGATIQIGWENSPPKGDGELEDSGVLSFNGTSDYIQEDATLVSTTPLTMSAWVKTSSSASQAALFIGDKDDGDRYHLLYVNGGNATVASRYDGSNQAAVGTTLIDDGEWHFITGVFSSPTSRKIYVDGVFETEQTVSVNVQNMDRWSIGRMSDNTPGTYFDGELANTAIWKDVRTASEIQADYQNGYVDTSDANLVSYWPLSGDALDWKGDNDGTITGTTTTKDLHRPKGMSAMNTGNVLSFDGDGDYVSVVDDSSLDFGSGNYTISTWIKTDDTDNNFVIGKRSAAAGDGYELLLKDTNTHVIIHKGSAGNLNGEFTKILDDGIWHHLVYGRDGGTSMFAYVDGVEYTVTNTISNDVSTDNSESLLIGQSRGNGTATNAFDGEMADTRIYNDALTASEVKNLYTNGQTGDYPGTDNLVSQWLLDDDSSTIADSAGPNTGNLVSGTWGKGKRPPLIGGNRKMDTGDLLDFDGGSDYIDCGVGVGNALGNGVTILSVSMWFNTDIATHNDGMFNIGNFAGSHGEFSIALVGGNLNVNTNNAANVASIPFSDTNSWTHVVGRLNGSSLDIFINGVLVKETSNGVSLDMSGLKGIIGSYYQAGFDFDGQIVDTRIYDSALTADEVKYIYTNGKEGVDPTTTNLVSQWLLDEGTGSTATDNHGSNNGTITGATWIENIKPPFIDSGQVSIDLEDINFTNKLFYKREVDNA